MRITERISKITRKDYKRIVPQVRRGSKSAEDKGDSSSTSSAFTQAAPSRNDPKTDRTDIPTLTSDAVPSKVLFRDPGKRQRIFVIAALVVILVFGLKIWQKQDWEVDRIVLVAAGASVLTMIGLLWAFRFDVSRRGFLTVLPQPALFVFGYVLFVEMFFFQNFERVYEAVIFGALLIVFMIVLGIVFLTANVLNVATIRNLPLLQVAQTSSYVITLFSVFFISFFIVDLGLDVWMTVLLLFALYFVSVFLHLSHFELPRRSLSQYVLAISFCAAVSAWVSLMWPVDTLFIVLLPTVVIYIGIGIVMHDLRKVLRPLLYWEYFLIILVVLVVLFSRSQWGIGGFVWS